MHYVVEKELKFCAISYCIMRRNRTAYNIVSILLSLLMLTNCTVYKPVQQSPESISSQYKMILIKDELRFSLKETAIKNDTLYAAMDYDDQKPGKRKKMLVVLKPNQEIKQDSIGFLVIPLSQIAHVWKAIKLIKPRQRYSLWWA